MTNPLPLLRAVAPLLRPQADRLIAEQGLPAPEAYVQALGSLLERLAAADGLRARDREVLAALWAVYRSRGEKPVERGWIIYTMDASYRACDESTVYRSLRRLREAGLVRMIGRQWEPLFDPEALQEAAPGTPARALIAPTRAA